MPQEEEPGSRGWCSSLAWLELVRASGIAEQFSGQGRLSTQYCKGYIYLPLRKQPCAILYTAVAPSTHLDSY